MQDNRDKETSTDEVQSKREFKKTIPPGAWMSVLSVLYHQVDVSVTG
jgi:hypothetical protein